jgi:hypothetical protein
MPTTDPAADAREEGVDTTSETSSGWVWFALLGGTLAIYVWTLEFGMIAGWDDELYLVRRPEVLHWMEASWRQRLLTPKLGYPVPIPTFVYYLGHQLPEGGTLPALHGFQLAVHLVNVSLVYALARRWLASPRWALATAGLWASHPLLVETVAWLTNLKGALLGTCVLGATWLWERHLEEASLGTAMGTVALVLAGLGCRPEAVMIGPVLAARTWYRHRDRLRAPLVWAPLATMALLSALYLPVALVGQFSHLADQTAPGTLDLGDVERLRRIAAALGLQLRHVVYPLELDPIYLHDAPGRWLDVGLGAILGVGLLVATVVTLRRWPETTAGWSLWWGLYLPASGLVYLPRFTADTYMYLPLVGLVIVSAQGLHRGLEATSFEPNRRLTMALLVVVLGTFGSIAWMQTGRWRHTRALFEPLTEQSPAISDAYVVLGQLAQRRGDTERARRIYEEGLPVLYRTGTVPLELPKAFEATGDPARAAALASKVLADDYPGPPPEGMEGYLTWVVVRHELPLPETSERRRIVRRAARRSVERYADDWGADVLAKGAYHFAGQGLPELAMRYAGSALERDPERCELWEWLQQNRRLDAIEFEPPATCR